MNDVVIHVNQVIRRKSDGLEYRVLWISKSGAPSYWIPLTKKGNTPQPFQMHALETEITSGSYEFTADRWYPNIPENDISIKWKARRDHAWEMIRGIVSREPDIYERNRRASLLKEASESYGVSFNNLYDYLGKYWKRGMVPNALLPDYGNVGKVRDVYKESSKRGGRPKRESAPGKKLALEDVQHFSAGIRKYYLTNDRNTLKDSYEYMIRDWYTTKEDGKEPETLPPDELPSFAQFSYWYHKNRDVLQEVRKREGERTYSLKNRALMGKTEDAVYGPGAASRVHCDRLN